MVRERQGRMGRINQRSKGQSMTREEAIERWRKIRALKKEAERRVIELLVHPNVTPEQIAEVRAVAIDVHNKYKEAQIALFTRWGRNRCEDIL